MSVRQTWRGGALLRADWVEFRLEFPAPGEDLLVDVDAPFWDDPAPPKPAGCVPELWRFSAAELFIWGGEDRYLELELGPHGHFWLLELQTWRKRCRKDLPCEFGVMRHQERWSGHARVSAELLPDRPWRLSACAIWGTGEQRVHAMSRPCPGERPDFHQAAAFGTGC